MASRTETVPRRIHVTKSRPHDHIYDPSCHLSSSQDHARAEYRARVGGGRLVRVPVGDNMFSALPHYPRMTLQMTASDPVPPSVNRHWTGGAAQGGGGGGASAAGQQGGYTAAHPRLPSSAEPHQVVSGQSRYLFFRRPVVPYLTAVPADVMLKETTTTNPMEAPAGLQHLHEAEAATRTVGTQSLYRESEAQTDPYTPDYVVAPGNNPEILTLAHLSFKHGLPAGLAEVEMIERARAKRAWEASLPPMSEPGAFEVRRQMMEEMEMREWLEREEEIKRVQEARLAVLKEVLEKREACAEEANNERIERVWRKKMKERELALARIEHKGLKGMRRLTEQRRNVEGKVERRNVISDYSNYASPVWAPQKRNGVFPDTTAGQFNARVDVDSLQGLLELEASLPASVLEPTVRAPTKGRVPRDPASRREHSITQQLEAIQQAIRQQKAQAGAPPPPLKFQQKIEKQLKRPPTPTLAPVEAADENYELALVFMQRMLRGRAVQNQMFEGKERRRELIRELRSTHILNEVESERKAAELRAQLKQEQREAHVAAVEHRDRAVEGHLGGLTGHVIGDTLSFLSKELVRLQEGRRIAAMVKLAERQRRMKEAEESGRRQREEERRGMEDEVFRQVMAVHTETVDSYLEGLVTDAVEATAETQGRAAIVDEAARLNRVVDELERVRAVPPEAIVANLVGSFLLPEVEKQLIRARVRNDQRRFLAAAHKAVHEQAVQVEEQLREERETLRDAAEREQASKARREREDAIRRELANQEAELKRRREDEAALQERLHAEAAAAHAKQLADEAAAGN